MELALLIPVIAITAAQVDGNPNNYILKDKANRKIFERRIVKEQLLHLKDVGHLEDGVQPIAVFVVGQTGSGKTRLAADLFDVMQGRQPAHLIADVYKAYHPEYIHLIKSHPNITCAATSTDARKWLMLTSRWLMQRRIDVLIESACRTPDDVISLMSDFHLANYRILVVIMAVPECLSLMGTIVRYWERRPEAKSVRLPLRVTPWEVHHETYEGILAVANFIDNSTAVSNVVVVRRNNLASYQNPRGIDGLWVRPASTLASLDLERTRPLLAAEHESFAADCLYVRQQQARKRKGWKGWKWKKGKESVTGTTLEGAQASLAGLMSIEGQWSTSFPLLKPLDIEEWMFGEWDINDVKSGTPISKESVQTVVPRISILKETARVQH
ncbi:hypothetical protein KVR01_008503 [Diaporthe batatas]|uniref:uncharacterized protein n=1 Tax=Diaporthe batatas TaxID=748121 RepID=UPI001D056627|nr:uncharacterized protein KVR01_008503 [Diaporthe batatas]KAG8161516.1 hypothetical protein KVR01_008503 [Diaporthe batatas]